MTTGRLHRVLLVVLLVATFAARLSAFESVYRADPSRVVSRDSPTYEGPARALLEAGRFSVGPTQLEAPEVTRTPGYPLFIAAIWRAFGEDRHWLIVAQILISLGTVAGVYLLGRLLAGSGVGLVAAGCFALDPTSFLYSQVVLSDTLFAFLLLAAVWAGARLIREERAELAWAMAFGALLAAATHVRPISYYLAPAALLLVLLAKRARRRPTKKIIALVLVAALPCVALIGGWQLRNHSATGRAEFSFIQSYNLLWYRGAGIVALRDGVPFDKAQQRIEAQLPDTGRMSEAEKAALYQRVGAGLIRRHSALFLRTEAYGLGKLLIGLGVTEVAHYFGAGSNTGPIGDLVRLPLGQYLSAWPLARPIQFGAAVLELALLLGMYAGLALSVVLIGRKQAGPRDAPALVWLVIAYLVAVGAGPEAYCRFRLPLMPLLALMGVWGWRLWWLPARSSPSIARPEDSSAAPTWR